MKRDKSRVRLSFRNIYSTLGSQVITMVVKFLVRTIFVYQLGAVYLGVNGLFTNIINVLSFAELGIGTAITYSLYKPLAEDDSETVSELMTLFKHVYSIIAGIVFVLGLCILPFLHVFVKAHVDHLQIIYILFVLNAAVSYLLTYRRTLLIADQRGYINVANQVIFNVLAAVFQIIVLFVWNSFIAYCVIQVICTVLSNIVISIRVKKMYNQIDYNAHGQVPKSISQKLISNTLGMIGSRIGGIAFDVTDNLVISSMIGVYWVGIYSNYTLLINSFNQVIGGVLNSFVSSIGNLAVSDDKHKSYAILRKHQFANFVIVMIVTAGLASCLNRFILLWLGSKYLLPQSVVFFIVINYGIYQLRQTDLAFISAYGLFNKIGWKSIIEAFVNVSLSIVFVSVFKLGISGVLLATTISNLFINIWYEPLIVVKLGIQIHRRGFYLEYTLYLFIMAVLIPVWFEISNFIGLSGWVGLITTGFINVLIAVLLISALFWNSDNYKYMRSLALSIIKTRLHG